MKAVVWHGPEAMALEEVAEPEAKAGGVLLAPEAVGICGSEVEGYLGRMGNRVPPLVMGHEVAGRVVAAGPGVDASWVGRRAAVNPLLPGLGARPGLENLGPRRELIGIHRPGGFADLVAVPVEALRPIPGDADARLAALAEPLANGVHSTRLGLRGLGGEAPERTVVLGAGTIGLMVVQAAVLGGLGRVEVVEPNAERRARGVALGAAAGYADASEADPGADVVIDAAGAEATRQAAVALLRPGGQAVLLGLAADATTLGFHGVVRGGISLHGSYAYTPEEFDQALSWLLEGRAGLGELAEVEPLDVGPERFAALASGASAQVKVFLAGAGAGADGAPVSSS